MDTSWRIRVPFGSSGYDAINKTLQRRWSMGDCRDSAECWEVTVRTTYILVLKERAVHKNSVSIHPISTHYHSEAWSKGSPFLVLDFKRHFIVFWLQFQWTVLPYVLLFKSRQLAHVPSDKVGSVIVGPGKGLSSARHEVTTWINGDYSLIG